jgi:hypothetical protein
VTAPALVPLSASARASQRPGLADLSHDLLDRMLAVRIHLGLGQPDDARRQLERAFLALVALDAAIPPEPPAAPAAGPLQIHQEPRP